MKQLNAEPFILVGGFFLVVVLVYTVLDWREAGILREAGRLVVTVVLFLTFAYFVVRLFGGYY